jgi:G:T-mismatch repair DNA endonuclease (very short patch repair protein)
VFSLLKHRADDREKIEERFANAKLSNEATYNARARLCNLEEELRDYLRVVPVVGFNSQRYDLNVLKGALIKELEEVEDSVEFTVKKMDAITVLKTSKLKFLDITNFIAPGFKYSEYLEAFQIEQKKGFFPYEWMDSIEKLDYTELPEQKDFYSKLTRKHLPEEDYKVVCQAWKDENMKTVRDLLVWYNNLDVEPFLMALEKQSEIYQQKNIDMLKEGISLPGLAVVWLFRVIERPLSIRQKFTHEDDSSLYTSFRKAILNTRHVRLIDKQDSDLYKLYKSNTVGGPSLVFHRYHQRGVTKIREREFGENAKLCQEVLGVDANALYLYCLEQNMPVGYPRRRHAEDQFRIANRKTFSKAAQGWLAWIDLTTGKRLETESGKGERRLGRHNLPVDGFCQETNTIYQFHGCFWHGHGCCPAAAKEYKGVTAASRLRETKLKETYLRALGYNLETVWECEWRRTVDSNPRLKLFLKAFNDTVYGVDKALTQEEVLEKILNGQMNGFVECDLHVPDHLLEKFAEMPPIFKNIELSREHLSDHMRQFAEDNDHLLRPQRCLIGSMKGEKILLLSDLLRWYMEHGLVVTKVYQVVEYETRPIFKNFSKSVSDTRRLGDVDASLKLLANTAKLIGNSLYGKTITDKTRHRNVTYTLDDNKASLNVRSNFFHSINPLDEGVYETVSFKKKVHLVSVFIILWWFHFLFLRCVVVFFTFSKQVSMDIPVPVGVTILNFAKKRMLEYFYDCLDR